MEYAIEQPSFSQLEAAFNNACMQAAFGDEARKAALLELWNLRNAKTSWFGDKEMFLRREIDRLLYPSLGGK